MCVCVCVCECLCVMPSRRCLMLSQRGLIQIIKSIKSLSLPLSSAYTYTRTRTYTRVGAGWGLSCRGCCVSRQQLQLKPPVHRPQISRARPDLLQQRADIYMMASPKEILLRHEMDAHTCVYVHKLSLQPCDLHISQFVGITFQMFIQMLEMTPVASVLPYYAYWRWRWSRCVSPGSRQGDIIQHKTGLFVFGVQ